MAIQIPNPGTGNGATGDNEFVLWSKVKDNFNDQTNAASRLVGITAGQVPLAEQVQKLNGAFLDINTTVGGIYDLNKFTGGHFAYVGGAANSPPGYSASTPFFVRTINTRGAGGGYLLQEAYNRNTAERQSRASGDGAVWSAWAKDYTTANTTKDANGFLKAASPIVKVHANSVVLNEEAEQQNVTYKRNGVGDYTITTVSGLSTDGWYIELPKDMNGNPKVAVTLSEVDGVISLKTYKRIFSMETFTFEPDLDSPLDIPDTRWIDLRLNEIPVEIEYDIQTEV